MICGEFQRSTPRIPKPKYFRNPSRSAHSVNSSSSRWHRSNHRLGIIFSVTKQKMAKNGTQVIEISPSSSERYSEEEEDNGTPLRPVFCVKRNTDIKRIEEIEECFILDFDPFDSVDISKLSVSNSPIDNEVSVVAEKGQVACRDYPHSRHLCMKFPFETTPHEQYCKLCYCYVCDSSAPCKYWMQHEQAHCHASEKKVKARICVSLPKKLSAIKPLAHVGRVHKFFGDEWMKLIYFQYLKKKKELNSCPDQFLILF
ncbi:uncharacterized protein LOC112008722 [Quercus suber]|uniref:uncharacterized protein LOC112008722 n=1 Tax=Quercus suber TaxID=58331 RepID=UPI000CE1C502|nr:uncharacterized protein LOC112008722 isoform X1 [Quercus suber]